jgi:hypothetical protein
MPSLGALLAADAAGHTNLKQRIQVTQTLKDQNQQLRETNARLLADWRRARSAATTRYERGNTRC